MVDIHSHILHSLDDGASSFELSLAMAELAVAGGTTDIVATPHANLAYSYQPELVAERIRELQHAIGPKLKIHRGCELHLSVQNIERVLWAPGRYSINGLGYLLMELPDVSLFQGIEHVFDKLKSEGLTPIVTHPERNPHLVWEIGRVRRWVESGVLLQITGPSLLGRFGVEPARWCLQVLAEGLVHFVASDAHDPVRRTPKLDEVRSSLVAQFDECYAELLLELNPRLVIEGLPIEKRPIVPSRTRQKKKWFGLQRFGQQ